MSNYTEEEMDSICRAIKIGIREGISEAVANIVRTSSYSATRVFLNCIGSAIGKERKIKMEKIDREAILNFETVDYEDMSQKIKLLTKDNKPFYFGIRNRYCPGCKTTSEVTFMQSDEREIESVALNWCECGCVFDENRNQFRFCWNRYGNISQSITKEKSCIFCTHFYIFGFDANSASEMDIGCYKNIWDADDIYTTESFREIMIKANDCLCYYKEKM